MKTLSVSISSPEKVVFQGDAEMVVVNAFEGEMGFLADHAPLVAKLRPGNIRVKSKEKTLEFAGTEGFVEVLDNKITILCR